MKTTTQKQTEVKHTPGPWHIIPFERQSKEINIEEPMIKINYENNKLEAEANADLICASPLLLQSAILALDLIREFHDEHGTTSPLRHSGNTDFKEEIMILKQAISKATGGAE